jgi:hypothetical protein
MFKMSLYLLKQNETQLLHLNFEEILTLIQEQPKIMLSGDCHDLDEMEFNYNLKNVELLYQGASDKEDEEADEESKQSTNEQSDQKQISSSSS